jgi:hypothetical protein
MEYDEDDIEQCPILQEKINSLSKEEKDRLRDQYNKLIKPKLQAKKKEQAKSDTDEKKSEKPKARERHPRLKQYQQAQGACPVMNSSMRSD